MDVLSNGFCWWAPKALSCGPKLVHVGLKPHSLNLGLISLYCALYDWASLQVTWHVVFLSLYCSKPLSVWCRPQWAKHLALSSPRKKMSRYFDDISCIEWYQHNISWRNIDPAIFRDKFREIDDISRYVGGFAINWRFFPIYRLVNTGQRKSNALHL